LAAAAFFRAHRFFAAATIATLPAGLSFRFGFAGALGSDFFLDSAHRFRCASATKTAQVVAMLQRKNGATLAEIMDQMGWQKHTVRGFMAGAMKKAGYTVESFKPEGGERTYRINQ